MYPNHKMDNVACDLMVNQIVPKDFLPSWGIFLEDFEKKYPELNWEKLAGRDHYYKELSKLTEEQKQEIGIDDRAKHTWIITDGEGNPVEGLSESEKASLQRTVEATIEDLAKEVEKFQGHVPAEIDALIKGFIKPKPKFDYKKYLRNFVGSSTKYIIGTSKIRENQRFPGQPKTILKPMGKILVLVDESGSVSEKELYDFLNEIYHIKKKSDIEIRAFDTEVTEIVHYKGNNEFPRSRCGGTSFTAAVNFYNESRYNSCIVFTDGFAEEPPKIAKKLLWVISSNGDPKAIQNHSAYIKIPKEE